MSSYKMPQSHYVAKKRNQDIIVEKVERSEGRSNDCDQVQTHVHEFLGSTMLAAPPQSEELLHNHRFAGVTGPVKPIPGGSHVHVICTNSDFFFNHFHNVELVTGPVIPVRDQNDKIIGHVHAFSGKTSCNFFHEHRFKGTTLIQNPIAMT